MKIICTQKSLAASINIVQKAVSSKTTLPVLKGILLETEENKLKLVGTDIELGIENYIDAEIIKSGSVVIASKILGEIIRKLPDSTVEIEVDQDNNTIFRCENSEFTLLGHSSIDFPELPEVEKDFKYSISQDLFKSMIKQTTFATTIDETRPVLTGVLMEIKDNKISMVALDGYRLALKQGNIKTLTDNKVIIPGKTLNEVYKILSEEDNDEIEIYFTEKHILFKTQDTRIISRLLEGEFVNYNQIIPREFKSRVSVNTRSLYDSIERASLMAKEGKNNLIKFSIKDEKMSISSNSEMGKVFESLSIKLEGADIEIGFNSKYFIDVLRVIDSEEVYLNFINNVSPCIIKPVDNNNYTHLILPVRITN
ncbi:MAG: DNA polymerase III subunit beta [Alkaliphilus sp.]|nr:DNA polymerase III subunit beta [Alkaliphilus sp.]